MFLVCFLGVGRLVVPCKKEGDEEAEVARRQEGARPRLGRIDVPTDLDGEQEEGPGEQRDGRVPQEEGQREKVPRIELVVKGSRKDDPNKVARKDRQRDIVGRAPRRRGATKHVIKGKGEDVAVGPAAVRSIHEKKVEGSVPVEESKEEEEKERGKVRGEEGQCDALVEEELLAEEL